MTIIIAAMQASVLSTESSKTRWRTHEPLKEAHPQCITFDPGNPIPYCPERHGIGRQTIVPKDMARNYMRQTIEQQLQQHEDHLEIPP